MHNRLGTCPDRDGFMVIDHKKGKRAKKNCKPTPQEEKEEADKVLLKREPQSDAPGKWQKITEVKYRDYHPYLFENSTMTNARQETHLFQAHYSSRNLPGEGLMETQERRPWSGLGAHHTGVFTDTKKAAMPLEGAYAIIDWLLKCMQQVNDNIIRPMCRSMKDALHCQDEEVQKATEAAKEATEKVRDCLHDSTRRQHYREA